jgi:hypothetical protein
VRTILGTFGDESIMRLYGLKQSVCLLTLFLFACLGDYYFTNVSRTITNVVVKQLIMFAGISVLFFIFNQFIYNFAKKEKDFMKHRIWKKMFFIVLMVMLMSFILFIILFFGTPLEAFINAQPWIMFLAGFYFLFLINLFVLSVVHNLVESSIKVERKLFITWIGSSLLAGSAFFLFPSF